MVAQTLFVYLLFIMVMYICGKAAYIHDRNNINTNYSIKEFFSNKSLLFLILFFSVLVGIRYDVGTDHLYYWVAYEYGEENSRMEFLFFSINKICHSLHFHPTIYFAILALLQITFFYLAFNSEKYIYPLFAIFLFTNGLFGSWVNTIRQDIAGCIWLYAFQYIDKKKFKKYLFWCILAFFFHRSAIILIILYPLLKSGKDRFTNTSLQLLIIAAAIILKDNISGLLYHLADIVDLYAKIISIGSDSDFYSTYTIDNSINDLNTNVSEIKQTGLGVLVKYIVYCIMVIFGNKVKTYFNNNTINNFYILFFVAFVLYIILPEGLYSLARPFQYFNSMLTIMLAFTTYYLIQVKQYSAIGIAIIIMQILMFFMSIILSGQNMNYKGYQFFFQ